jgi:hypothetical protein
MPEEWSVKRGFTNIQEDKGWLESQEERWLVDGEKRFEENDCQRLKKHI